MKFVLQILLAIGALFITPVLLFLYINGQLQFLHSDSKLGMYETRIASVNEEFMRRSPELRKNYAEFQTCIRRTNCNYSTILERRDVIVQSLWPELLSRLSVDGDWGQGWESDTLHTRFKEDLKEAGSAQKTVSCVPLIRYYQQDGSLETSHRYEGLRCLRP